MENSAHKMFSGRHGYSAVLEKVRSGRLLGATLPSAVFWFLFACGKLSTHRGKTSSSSPQVIRHCWASLLLGGRSCVWQGPAALVQQEVLHLSRPCCPSLTPQRQVQPSTPVFSLSPSLDYLVNRSDLKATSAPSLPKCWAFPGPQH